MTTERYDFWTAYEEALCEAVTNFPEDYPPGVKPAEFASKVALKFSNTSFADINHDGRGFKLACKKVGIKHTRKAIKAYLEGQ